MLRLPDRFLLLDFADGRLMRFRLARGAYSSPPMPASFANGPESVAGRLRRAAGRVAGRQPHRRARVRDDPCHR